MSFLWVLFVTDTASGQAVDCLSQQNIGYPVCRFQLIDTDQNGIFELALQVGEEGEKIGIYCARTRQLLDGPHHFTGSNVWWCMDYEDDGNMEYIYPSNEEIRLFDPVEKKDLRLVNLDMPDEMFKLLGLNNISNESCEIGRQPSTYPGVAPLRELQTVDVFYFQDSILFILPQGGLPPYVTRVEIQNETNYETDSTTPTPKSFPNPFSPCELSHVFTISESGHVKFEVFSVDGKRITVLIDQCLPAGMYHVTWDGKDSAGTLLENGIYFFRVIAGEYRSSKKMIFMR
jgi:hypothetical protein